MKVIAFHPNVVEADIDVPGYHILATFILKESGEPRDTFITAYQDDNYSIVSLTDPAVEELVINNTLYNSQSYLAPPSASNRSHSRTPSVISEDIYPDDSISRETSPRHFPTSSARFAPISDTRIPTHHTNNPSGSLVHTHDPTSRHPSSGSHLLVVNSSPNHPSIEIDSPEL